MTRRSIVLFLLVLGFGVATTRAGEEGGRLPEEFHRGMVLGLFSDDGGGEAYRTDLRELQALGVDSVSLLVPWSMASVRSSRIFRNPQRAPSGERIRRVVGEAHRRGMRVMLFPSIYVEHLEGEEWRGTLEPEDEDGWWDSYEAFIAEHARLAAEQEVEILSIGSELCSLESRARRWKGLVRSIRSIYPGRLTYSANWDHLEPMLAWSGELDLVGMNAYYEVGHEGSSPSDLRRSWKPVIREVAAWRQRHGKPLLITEVGYPSIASGTRYPWDYTAAGSPDPSEQARGYRAFLEAWSGVEGLAGTYFYLWWDAGGPQDTGYTPRGKPAAKVLADWYTD